MLQLSFIDTDGQQDKGIDSLIFVQRIDRMSVRMYVPKMIG